jgi:Peptidase family M48
MSGLSDYARDPSKMDKDLMLSVVSSSGADAVHNRRSVHFSRVERIGSRVVATGVYMRTSSSYRVTPIHSNPNPYQSALDYSSAKVDEIYTTLLRHRLAHEQAKKHGKTGQELSDMRDDEQQLLVEAQHWSDIRLQLKGDWHYVVTNSKAVNAFVTDLCPRRIFVHEGLLELIKPTDDELALILSHEISHLMLGHTHKRGDLQSNIAKVQLVLMTLVDSTGYWTFLFDLLSYKLGSYLIASDSRHGEEEADELGIVIAARACFDTKKGSNIFHKFEKLEVILLSKVFLSITLSSHTYSRVLFSYLNIPPFALYIYIYVCIYIYIYIYIYLCIYLSTVGPPLQLG